MADVYCVFILCDKDTNCEVTDIDLAYSTSNEGDMQQRVDRLNMCVCQEIYCYNEKEVAINPASGLTSAEDACHDALMESYRQFIGMPRQHPDEMREFVDAVHKIQGLLTDRIARRCFPERWKTYVSTKDQI